ncbi:hypothetical protein CCZ01_07945 [Helicobacter monodelphidis]|uniref:hypothetical protein n=1 Tax=Helicobacter sp. 15-1451 TaxID=2004995 RepID=UPI000DCD9DFD|nr:hypothetical protein [Helicobacter sp. 15-1451]RAX56976.1 hypothetical protein CCZ01_07945 [Helicobacter sp. 15-1451]
MQKYPEVYSLEESLAILDKYKGQITQDQYEQNVSIIGNHAIEDIFLNESDIISLIEMDTENLTADEMIQRLRDKGEL